MRGRGEFRIGLPDKARRRELLIYCWHYCQWKNVAIRDRSIMQMVGDLTGQRMTREYAYMWLDQQQRIRPTFPPAPPLDRPPIPEMLRDD